MAAYYNEFDPFAADWLESLIKEGAIADGIVDRRSIKEVSPADVEGFTQVHFFAGIGGWSLALRLAGWPDDRPVWTGSCPCQPFSAAGKQKAQSDERHLWPVMFGLIKAAKPVAVFGEQVASAIGHGWLDGIFADLEGENYSVGAIVLGAHSVGAPHIRQRLYWVADLPVSGPFPSTFSGIHCGEKSTGTRNGESERRGSDVRVAVAEDSDGRCMSGCSEATERGQVPQAGRCCRIDGMGNADISRANIRTTSGGSRDSIGESGPDCGLEHSTSDGRNELGTESSWGSIAGGCVNSGLADADINVVQRIAPARKQSIDEQNGGVITVGNASSKGLERRSSGGRSDERTAWVSSVVIDCTDGKSRRVGCGVQPLAYGIPRDMGSGKPELRSLVRCARSNRVGRLKGYGNAIVPQVAAEFVRAFMEISHPEKPDNWVE